MLLEEEKVTSYQVVVKVVLCQVDSETFNHSWENEIPQNTAVLVFTYPVKHAQKRLALNHENVTEILTRNLKPTPCQLKQTVLFQPLVPRKEMNLKKKKNAHLVSRLL